MKNLITFVIGTIISASAISDTCQHFPQVIEDAVNSHISSIRAYEYCEARKIAENGKSVAVFYTAEGACGDNKDFEPGTCGNNWEQYMAAKVNGKLIEPVMIGGKGMLMAEEIKFSGDVIEISGLTVGENDGLCCPSIPETKRFEVTDQGFKQVPSYQKPKDPPLYISNQPLQAQKKIEEIKNKERIAREEEVAKNGEVIDYATFYAKSITGLTIGKRYNFIACWRAENNCITSVSRSVDQNICGLDPQFDNQIEYEDFLKTGKEYCGVMVASMLYGGTIAIHRLH